MKKIILIWVLLLAFAGMAPAAPLVVIPGTGSGYLYFPPVVNETIGKIAVFPTTAPSGWLECDGSTIQATDYPRLVAYLAGPNATSAVLPDLRGEFVRGWDHGRGIDAGRVLGSVQTGENIAHTHSGTTSLDGNHLHVGTVDPGGLHGHRSDPYIMMGTSATPTFSSDDRGTGDWGSWRSLAQTDVSGAHSHTLTLDPAGEHTHTFSVDSEGGMDPRPRNYSSIYAIKALNI